MWVWVWAIADKSVARRASTAVNHWAFPNGSRHFRYSMTSCWILQYERLLSFILLLEYIHILRYLLLTHVSRSRSRFRNNGMVGSLGLSEWMASRNFSIYPPMTSIRCIFKRDGRDYYYRNNKSFCNKQLRASSVVSAGPSRRGESGRIIFSRSNEFVVVGKRQWHRRWRWGQQLPTTVCNINISNGYKRMRMLIYSALSLRSVVECSQRN